MVETYKYTLGFVRAGDKILFLNRQKAPWMGRWNGIGGKLDAAETPLQCIVREAYEETGLSIEEWQDRGVMRWFRDGADLGGVHLFTAEISEAEATKYPTPYVHCHEGILDWKLYEWLVDADNSGVVDNVKIMLQDLWTATPTTVWESHYEDMVLLRCERTR